MICITNQNDGDQRNYLIYSINLRKFNLKKMKTIRKHLKMISLLISISFFIQSCTVYHSSTASIDEAVQSDNKIKLGLTNHDAYIFQKLERENGNIYGITGKDSRTAKLLSSQITEDTKNNNQVKVLLTNEQLKNIRLKNKTMSTIVTIGIPVLALTIISIFVAEHTGPDGFAL